MRVACIRSNLSLICCQFLSVLYIWMDSMRPIRSTIMNSACTVNTPLRPNTPSFIFRILPAAARFGLRTFFSCVCRGEEERVTSESLDAFNRTFRLFLRRAIPLDAARRIGDTHTADDGDVTLLELSPMLWAEAHRWDQRVLLLHYNVFAKWCRKLEWNGTEYMVLCNMWLRRII